MAAGRKPWTFGYHFYKRRMILQAIERGLFRDGQLTVRYGFRVDERVVEYPWLFSRLPVGPGRLLDAGSTLNYGFLLKREPLASKKLFICTLAPESDAFWRRSISYVFDDLRCTSFRDETFDYVVSISTIEHIGLDNTLLYTRDVTKKEAAADTYVDAIREFRRIVRPGGKVFLSVPFGKHKNHGWFQVFDAAMVDRTLAEFSPAHHAELYFKYGPNGWRRAEPQELREATVFDIQEEKGYDFDFAASAHGLVCMEMTK